MRARGSVRRALDRLVCLLLLLLTPLMTAVAQTADSATASASQTAPRKSPALARIIGIVPGAGHMYAGETGRGLAYLGATVGVLVVGGALIGAKCVGDVYLTTAPTCPSPALENVLAVAVLGIWAWSIYDAGRAAQRTNARRGLHATLRIAPGHIPTALGNAQPVLHLGLTLARR